MFLNLSDGSSFSWPLSSADMIGLGYRRHFASSCLHFLFCTQNPPFLKMRYSFKLDILLRDRALAVGAHCVKRQGQMRHHSERSSCSCGDSFGPVSVGDHWPYRHLHSLPVMKEYAHSSVFRNIALKAPGVINSFKFTLAFSCPAASWMLSWHLVAISIFVAKFKKANKQNQNNNNKKPSPCAQYVFLIPGLHSWASQPSGAPVEGRSAQLVLPWVYPSLRLRVMSVGTNCFQMEFYPNQRACSVCSAAPGPASVHLRAFSTETSL